MYDAILAYTLKHGVLRFRGSQQVPGELDVEIVPGPNFSRELESEILRTWRLYLGNDMVIRLNQVNNIMPDPSGKLRYFVTELANHS